VNVVVPWTYLDPETEAALPPGAKLVWTGGSRYAYHDLLDWLWEEADTVLLVEHDIVPPPGALEEMAACPHEWCAVPYRCGDLLMTALGCTKIDGALMARCPDVISRIQHREWWNLDTQIVATLRRQGAAEHIHQPPARHLKYDRDNPASIEIRRSERTMRLLYVGDGTRYLNGVPATDLDTEDPDVAAICLASGLYIEAEKPKTLGRQSEPVSPEPEVAPEPEPTPAIDAEQA
jgi:hypothetical protein